MKLEGELGLQKAYGWQRTRGEIAVEDATDASHFRPPKRVAGQVRQSEAHCNPLCTAVLPHNIQRLIAVQRIAAYVRQQNSD